jgi:hypothetical protein
LAQRIVGQQPIAHSGHGTNMLVLMDNVRKYSDILILRMGKYEFALSGNLFQAN